MQTIAVIGGTGRVGRLLVARLAQQPARRIVVLGRNEPVTPPAGNITFARVRSPDDIATAVGEAPRSGAPCPELDTPERLFAAKYFGLDTMPYDGRHAWLRLVPESVVSWDFRKLPGDRPERAG